ncbi:MAG: hypothetical protein KBT12_02305 [Bacteroidales bacterium]|nr:hypothetical protein [Candidatus Physcousia equi]
MEYVFDEWKETLENYEKSINKTLGEMRQCRADVQRMKTEILNAVAKGYYRRDEERIVLSAPEIIIGDVDKDGNLWMNGEHSRVIIRSNDISIEGVASTIADDAHADLGSITCRAGSIKHLAVDPGPAGNENVVFPGKSEVVTLAKGVKISTIDNDWVLPNHSTSAHPGVAIHSCGTLNIDSSVPNKSLKGSLEELKNAQEHVIDNINQDRTIEQQKKVVDDCISQLKALYENAQKLQGKALEDVRTNSMEILDLRNKIEQLLPSLHAGVTDYVNTLAEVANANREMKDIDRVLTSLPDESKYNQESTDASLLLNAEHISLTTHDGENKFRDTKEAGVECNARSIVFTSKNKDKLTEEGLISLTAKNIDLMAVEKTVAKDKTTMQPVGNIRMQTKEMEISSNEYSLTEKDDKPEPPTMTKQTEGSKLVICMPSTEIASHSEKGEATGKVVLNAKDVQIMSTKKKQNKKEGEADQPEELMTGGKIAMISENVLLGGTKENKQTAKTITADTETLTLNADKTMTMNVKENKSQVSLDEKGIKLSGDNNNISGGSELTVDQKTTFSKDVNGQKAEFKSVNGTNCLLGPNTNDRKPGF